MHEILSQVVSFARGAWRYRWHALLVAWLVALIGWGFVYSLPNQYKSSARVYADTDSMLGPLLKGLAVEPNVHSRVRLIANTLLSRPNMEKVARQTGAYVNSKDTAQLADEMAHKVRINGGGRQDLYTLSYDDSNPVMAQKVVRSLLNILMNKTLGSNALDTQAARHFLQQQIQDYSKRLSAAEQRLAAFKKKHVGMIPSQGGGDYYSRLQQAQQILTSLKEQKQTAVSRRSTLDKQMKDMQAGVGIGGDTNNPATQRLDAQISRDRDKLDQLLLTYTSKYPDVLALKGMIKRLKARKKDLQNAAKSGEPVSIDSSNPVYQNLQNQISDAEVQVNTLGTKIEQQQHRIQQLTQQVDTVTDVQTKLQALNRNYAVTRKQYQTLVSRLNQADISQSAAHSGNNIKFRIIDPPLKPVAPSSPNRLLLLTVVLGFSLVVGAAFALFLSQIRPVFMDKQMLTRITGRPVLGTVSLVWTQAQRRMRRTELTGFGLALSLIIVVYGGCVLFVGQFTHLMQGLLTG